MSRNVECTLFITEEYSCSIVCFAIVVATFESPNENRECDHEV